MAEPESTGQRPEREYEIGRDELWSSILALIVTNAKRTYDEYQGESLETIRQNRRYAEKVLSDAQDNTMALRNVSLQCLQNAVESANMTGKQAIRHGDLAIDRQWNQDEVSSLTAKTSTQLDALVSVLVEKLRAEK